MCYNAEPYLVYKIMYQRRNYKRNNRYHRSNRNRSRNKNRHDYRTHPDMYVAKAQSGEEVSIYTDGSNFTDFDLSPVLQKNIAYRKYTVPTKIQHQAIPLIIEGKDVLGLASTGSGKTGAFLLPMIDKVLKDKSQKCLIVVPTRELAEQIREELIKFSYGTYISSVLVIGGKSIGNQIRALRRTPQFVIGTPGRIIDLWKRNVLPLNTFNNVILDEVDRMLDMGFIRDIEFLISNLMVEKQSLFFSATMSSKEEVIANKLLRNPVKIQIAQQSPTKNIEQDVVRVDRQNKMQVLHDLLKQEGFDKVLIFSRTKYGADKIALRLSKGGFQTAAIHSNKTQSSRIKTIKMFKSGRLRILVATDVASRGLDIDDITHVINYDEPESYEDYIHRIGRTGRAGKTGTALTFIG